MIVRVVILVPVFNDWKALSMLLPRLDQTLRNEGVEARVLVVDDASSTQNYEDFVPAAFDVIKEVDVLELRRNLGHQRAIAVGLAYVEAKMTCQAVVNGWGRGGRSKGRSEAHREMP